MSVSPTLEVELGAGERIRRLEKINRALMGRVERSLDHSGGAFSLFQAAILLEDKVKARTHDLEGTLANLSQAYVSLQEARDDAEMAKQNLTAAIEAISEGFALFDSDEKLVMCNRQFGVVLPDSTGAMQPGISFARLAGIFSESPHLVRDNATVPQAWAERRVALFRQPHASFIQQFSNDRWLQISNRRMVSGATVIFQTDITDSVRSERQRHERELDEQARLLRATLDHLPQGICMFSRTMLLRTWNRAFVDLLGLPVKVLTEGVSLTNMFKLLHAARFTSPAADHARLQRWMQDPSGTALSPVELVRSDGMIMAVSAQSMPDGGAVLTFTDVTLQRRATLALQDANETLEQRVEERTRALRQEVVERRAIEAQLLQAKNDAEEANKGKTRFLAAASHDLLQPLNAARIFLSLLQEADLTVQQARFAGNADKAFGSVEQLLEALLDISRLETRNVETKVEAVALADMLHTLTGEFQPLCERKNIDLRLVTPHLWVRSDAGLLRRIIQNLLSNAVRYTSRGRVLVGARRRGNSVAIEVWDTGLGIAADKIGIIFEEFRRLHADSGNEQKAMGLGLAIVDRIAKLLDHTITVRSVPGRGSCFSLLVPLAETPLHVASPAVAPVHPRPASRTRHTVMLIENDLSILEGMVELLQSRGFYAVPTVSAEEAQEALLSLQQEPDLIIADFHLDSGTGVEAIGGLRKACGRAIPAIMVTANHSLELRETLEASHIAFLGKPLKPQLLFDTIHILLGS